MTQLTDDHLAQLALALEAAQDRTRRWTSPPRLLALPPVDPDALTTALATDTVPWRRLGEGNPYHLLERATLDPPDAVAIALVVHGWAFPPDDPDSWYGRPSQHPARVRVRTVAIVTADRRDCSALRLMHGEPTVERDGKGALMAAMFELWDRPQPAPGARPARGSRLAAARPAQPAHPAHCRRDHR